MIKELRELYKALPTIKKLLKQLSNSEDIKNWNKEIEKAKKNKEYLLKHCVSLEHLQETLALIPVNKSITITSPEGFKIEISDKKSDNTDEEIWWNE